MPGWRWHGIGARAAALAASARFAFALAAQPAHDWGPVPVYDADWDRSPALTSEVLSDSLIIRIRNVKPQYVALFFERRKVVRFAGEEEIARYGPVVLPESLDPPYDNLGKPWAQRATRPYPLLFNVRIDFFAARIVRPDGSWDELPVATRAARGFLGNDFNAEAVMAVTHYPKGMQPGDVVEYHWQYMIPYDLNAGPGAVDRGFFYVDNWARLANWRIFFHGPLPIRSQRIALRYHAKHGIVLGGEQPARKELAGDERTAVWAHDALPGVMDEACGAQGTELPHATVTWAPDDLRYLRRERLSGLPIAQQHWMQAVRVRQVKDWWLRRVAVRARPSRQDRLLRRFIARGCAGIADSLKARCMEALHERIARDFAYQDDRRWYWNLDLSLERLGDQCEEQRLRDISRFNLYCKLLHVLRIPYATAYVLDRRAGALNDQFTTPMWETDFLIGIRDGEGLLWMHPKRQRHGWFANELPFYWEGTMALLVDQERFYSDDPLPPLFMELPQRPAAANQRAIEYAIAVDLEKPDAAGEARVYLSGQFSTLGRAAYLGGRSDSTALPAYGFMPAMAPGVDARRAGEPELGAEPPFRYRERQELRLPAFRQAEPGGLYAFDLAGFIAHAATPDFRAEGRDLPFHWDFAHTDRFILDFTFKQPVEIMDLTQLQGEWATPGARYTLEATRIDARHLRIESRLQVLREREEPADAIALEGLLRAALRQDRVLRVRWLAEQ